MPFEYGPVNKKMVETGNPKLDNTSIGGATSPLPRASGQPNNAMEAAIRKLTYSPQSSTTIEAAMRMKMK